MICYKNKNLVIFHNIYIYIYIYSRFNPNKWLNENNKFIEIESDITFDNNATSSDPAIVAGHTDKTDKIEADHTEITKLEEPERKQFIFFNFRVD